jgi:phosphoserine aminotransferase
MLSLRHLKSKGLRAIYTANKEKAKVVYDAIDRNSLFSGVVEETDRSLMNITFVINNDDLEAEFLENCEAAGCVGLKGHRSVGGFRASVYNAMSLQGVNTLAEVMDGFQNKFG